MSTPGTTPDHLEQAATPTRDAAPTPAVDVPLDAPEADVVEQATAVGASEHAADRELPLEADAGDAAEQAVVVPLDDDERR